MKRPRQRTFRRSAEAKALASPRFRQRIVKNRKLYSRKGRRPTGSGLFDSLSGERRTQAEASRKAFSVGAVR